MASSNAFALLEASDDEDIESKYMTKKAKQHLQQQKAKEEAEKQKREEAEKQKRAVAVQANAQAQAQRVAASLFSVPSSSSGTSSAAASAPQGSNQSNANHYTNGAGTSSRQTQRQAARDRGDSRAFRRTFQKVFVENNTNTVVLRLHETDIVRVKPNGDVILNSGGWTTWKTMQSMNDVLELFDMAVASTGGSVNAGNWIVDDGHGKKYRYADNMLVPAGAEEDRHRARIVLEEYELPVPAALVPKPVTTTARPPTTIAPQTPAASRPPVAAGGSSPASATRAPPPASVAGNPAPPPAMVNNTMPAAAAVDPAMLGPKSNPEVVAKQLEQVEAQLNHAHLENVAEEDICTVCWERLRQIVLIPCGHLVLCEECLEEIMGKPEKLCPMCREPIAEALPVV